MKRKKPICTWEEDADGIWYSQCGTGYMFETGTPKENRFKYCPYCGKLLVQVRNNEHN